MFEKLKKKLFSLLRLNYVYPFSDSVLFLADPYFSGFHHGPSKKQPSINLPPPSIPKESFSSANNMWSEPPKQSRPPVIDSNKDIAILGADIIAATFGEVGKKVSTPLMEESGGGRGPGLGGPPPAGSRPLQPPPVSAPPPLLSPGPGGEFPPNQDFNQPGPPEKLEWNPRLGPPPPPRKLMGQDFGGGWPPENRPPAGPGQSPFSCGTV